MKRVPPSESFECSDCGSENIEWREIVWDFDEDGSGEVDTARSGFGGFCGECGRIQDISIGEVEDPDWSFLTRDKSEFSPSQSRGIEFHSEELGEVVQTYVAITSGRDDAGRFQGEFQVVEDERLASLEGEPFWVDFESGEILAGEEKTVVGSNVTIFED